MVIFEHSEFSDGNPSSFGAAEGPSTPIIQLSQHGIPYYVVRRGQALADALRPSPDGLGIPASVSTLSVGR